MNVLKKVNVLDRWLLRCLEQNSRKLNVLELSQPECARFPECVRTLPVLNVFQLSQFLNVLELSKLLNVLELSQMSSKSWTVVGPVLGTKLYNAECSQTLKMSSKQMIVVKILNVFKVSCFPTSNHKML